jgi:hypothetical protein
MVLVAAVTPAWAASDTVTPTQALSHGRCRPTAIGTVTSVHADPRLFGTDVVLNRQDGKEGMLVATIPAGNVKEFPALDTYMEQKVAIWTRANLITDRFTPMGIITMPLQLQLLSTALADPEKS